MTAFPHAVLFDMDGTLVDSEPRWDVALEELAALLGGDLDPQVRAQMVGTNEGASVILLLESLGRPLDEAPEHQAWLRLRMRDLFRQGVPWKPGAHELLNEVRRAGLPTALVTSTPRELADLILDQLGPDNFDVTVCGDEVEHKKPDPEPYLVTADKLGVDIAQSIVLEDSLTGVTSAMRAGAVTIAIPSEIALPPEVDVLTLDSLSGTDLDYLRGLAPAT
ncbi:HAD family phosphatase [Glycomyces halotolerans]